MQLHWSPFSILAAYMVFSATHSWTRAIVRLVLFARSTLMMLESPGVVSKPSATGRGSLTLKTMILMWSSTTGLNSFAEDDIDLTAEQMIQCYRACAAFKSPFEVPCSRDTFAIATEWLYLAGNSRSGLVGNRVNRFAGYIDGRLHVTTPNWWTREVRRALIDADTVTRPDCRGIAKLWRKSNEWTIDGVDTVSANGTELTLVSGKQTAKLDRAQFHETLSDEGSWDPKLDGAIAADMNDKYCAVAAGCSTYGPGTAPEIHVFTAAGDRLLWWRSLDQGLLPGVSYSGGYNGCFVSLSIDEDRIAVWYAHDISLGLMVFDAASGRCVGRFSTIYFTGQKSDE
jgi:hypothetical protein